MPLTEKGNKIMDSMQSQYGNKKGKKVFYASRNAGKISGVDPESAGSKKSKETKDKPGRSLVDVEIQTRKPESGTLCDEFTHPVHKGYGKGGDSLGLDGAGAITWAALDPPAHDGSGAAQFTKGKQSANRDIGQGLHYGAPIEYFGPDTDFRAEEINPHHYGRDYEPAPFKDLFKTEDKAEEMGIRLREEAEYSESATPGTVQDKGLKTSMAYGVIGYEDIPTEMPDNRSFESESKFKRSQDKAPKGEDENVMSVDQVRPKKGYR